MDTIKIWEQEVPYFKEEYNQQPPNLLPFLLPGENNPCCIVFPGGGYAMKAMDHEGVQVAQWLNTIGISAFVFDYRVGPYDGRAILADGQQAIRFVRARAAEYGLDRNRIGVCGFSAGGHLAGSCTTMFTKMEERPDFSLLCYAVLTLVEGQTHNGTAKTFLGENASNPEEQKKWSPVHRINKDSPPMFLWTTNPDKTVPPLPSTYAMYDACKALGIPTELVTFDHGWHGLGIPRETHPIIATWINSCEAWLRKINII